MIVVDANIIACLLLPGTHTQNARAVFRRDPVWTAPLLWRSEVRNVLATTMRNKHLDLADATLAMNTAIDLLTGGEYAVDSTLVLELAHETGCSAYDCEYVALARELGVPLITEDRGLLTFFPNNSVRARDFASVCSPPNALGEDRASGFRHLIGE